MATQTVNIGKDVWLVGGKTYQDGETEAVPNIVNLNKLEYDPSWQLLIKISNTSIKHSSSDEIDVSNDERSFKAQDAEAPITELESKHEYDEIIKISGILTDERGVLSHFTQEAANGQKNVVVKDASNFSSGDKVVLADDHWYEYNTISSISNNTLTLSNNIVGGEGTDATSYKPSNDAYIFKVGDSTDYYRPLSPMSKKDALFWMMGRQGIEGTRHVTTDSNKWGNLYELGVQRHTNNKLRKGTCVLIKGNGFENERYRGLIKTIDINEKPEGNVREVTATDGAPSKTRMEIKIEFQVGQAGGNWW